MQLKDVYKDDFAHDMGLFGGLDGFKAWMTLNTHPMCPEKVFFLCVICFLGKPHFL
jgi:hypothetical protein